MRLFISWSKPSAKQLAELLREWIPNVIPTLDIFVSSEDIEKGTRWYAEIDHELRACAYGLVIVTSENLHQPWLHFEAGAIAAILARRMSPVVFGLNKNDIDGALSMFQATELTKDDMRRLIRDINNAMSQLEGSAKIPEARVLHSFEKNWGDLETGVSDIALATRMPITAASHRTPEQLLTEVVTTVRNQARLLEAISMEQQDLRRTSQFRDLQLLHRIRNLRQPEAYAAQVMVVGHWDQIVETCSKAHSDFKAMLAEASIGQLTGDSIQILVPSERELEFLIMNRPTLEGALAEVTGSRLRASLHVRS